MKDFINTLNNHGYTAKLNEDSQELLIAVEPDADFWESYPLGTEMPGLAFWCLDEIERLGEEHVHLCRENHDTWAIRFYGGYDSGSYMSGMYGKTKTEACMRALMAVLD